MPSGVWPTVTVSTTRGGLAATSMTLIVSASPPPVPILATTATLPSGVMSMPGGGRPADTSRLVYSTLPPSIDRTEILLSPSRVTSAVLPSDVNTAWLGPDALLPKSTTPAGVTVLPLIENTETVPSERLATSASVPALLMETPAAPAPASRVAITAGGDAFRSMTESLLSGTVFLGSAGSSLVAAVTSATDSSGATATLSGGPTTLAGALISWIALGGEAARSMIVTLSAGGL